MTTSSVNKSNETLYLQRQEALESSKRSALIVKDSIGPASQEVSLPSTSPEGPKLEAPQKHINANNAMLEFCSACSSAYEASASASAAQTTNVTNLNKLNNALEYTVLYSTQIEIAKEQAEQQIENNLASAIDEAQKRESGVGSIIGWVGFGIVTVMVLAELIFTAGGAAPAAAAEEAEGLSLVAGDEAIDGAEGGAEMTSVGDGVGSAADLESEQAEVEEEMVSNKAESESVQNSAKDTATDQTDPKGNEEEEGSWSKFKNKVKDGCRWITQKVRPNPQSYLYRGLKFTMSVTGSATSATPQIIKGVDGIAIGDIKTQLAGCQQELGTLKGALQGNIATATSFQTLNKKMGDLLNELVGNMGSVITTSSSGLTTWGKVEIEG